jgi:hypothetical protein
VPKSMTGQTGCLSVDPAVPADVALVVLFLRLTVLNPAAATVPLGSAPSNSLVFRPVLEEIRDGLIGGSLTLSQVNMEQGLCSGLRKTSWQVNKRCKRMTGRKQVRGPDQEKVRNGLLLVQNPS